MYLLLIIIHSIFIYSSYIIGSYLLVIFFSLSFLTLSFYFSPFFFLKDSTKVAKKNISFTVEDLSILATKSILLPVILFYIAIYGIIYSIFGELSHIVHYHTLIGAVFYLLFVSYYLITQQWNDVFYDLARYHTIFIILSWIVYSIFFGFINTAIDIYFTVLFIFSLVFAMQILVEWSEFRGKDTYFYILFLLGIAALLYIILGEFWNNDLFFWSLVLIPFSLSVFFLFPRVKVLLPYENISKYFSVICIYVGLIFSYILLYKNELIESFTIGVPIILFLLYIHTLYENYISYFCSITTILLLYSSIFNSLLFSGFSSAFLFIFFLPALLIGSTYFIRQRHHLDFIILHYSSILSGIGFSLYYLFSIAPTSELILYSSFFILGISTLSFMSYFRFRYL